MDSMGSKQDSLVIIVFGCDENMLNTSNLYNKIIFTVDSKTLNGTSYFYLILCGKSMTLPTESEVPRNKFKERYLVP